MGKAFFTGWALWEKVTFVLACATVCTVLLGCLKLLYTRRKMRQYMALQTSSTVPNTETQPSMTQDIEARPVSHIPFGIRAIQSGIQVEGIWISPSATPILRHSAESSSGSSYKPLSQLGSAEILPHQPVQNDRRAIANSDGGSSSTDSVVNLDRDFGVGRGTRAYHLGTPYLCTEATKSYARVPANSGAETNQVMIPNGNTVLNIRKSSSGRANALSGAIDFSQIGHTLLGSRASNFRNSSSSLSSVVTYAPVAGSQQQSYALDDLENDEDGDLGLLDRHRLQHVASTGQLISRVRPIAREEPKPRQVLSIKPGHPESYEMATNKVSQPARSKPSVMPIHVVHPNDNRPQSQTGEIVYPEEPSETQDSPETPRPFSFTESLRSPSPESLSVSPVSSVTPSTSSTTRTTTARIANPGFEVLPGSKTVAQPVIEPETRQERKRFLELRLPQASLGGQIMKKLQKKKRMGEMRANVA